MADPESGIRWADISDSDESSDEDTPQHIERRTPVHPVPRRPTKLFVRPGAMDYNNMDRHGGMMNHRGNTRDYTRGMGHNRRGGTQYRGMGDRDEGIWKKQTKDANYHSTHHSNRPTSTDLRSKVNIERPTQATSETTGFVVEGFNPTPNEEMIRDLLPIINEQDTVKVIDGRVYIKLYNKAQCSKFWDERPITAGNQTLSWKHYKDMPNAFFGFERGVRSNEKTVKPSVPSNRHTSIASRNKPDHRPFGTSNTGNPKRNGGMNATITSNVASGGTGGGPASHMLNAAAASDFQQSSFARENFGTKLIKSQPQQHPPDGGNSEIGVTNNVGTSFTDDSNTGGQKLNTLSRQIGGSSETNNNNTQRAQTGSGSMRGRGGGMTNTYGQRSHSKNAYNNSMANSRQGGRNNNDKKTTNNNNRGGGSMTGRGGTSNNNNNNHGSGNNGGFYRNGGGRYNNHHYNNNSNSSSAGWVNNDGNSNIMSDLLPQNPPIKDEPVKKPTNSNRYADLYIDVDDDDEDSHGSV